MTRLLVQGIQEQRSFDVKPLSVDSTYPIYVTNDEKYVIKIVDASPIDHFAKLFHYFHERFEDVKKHMTIDARKKGYPVNTIDCLGYALTSMWRAFPFDFGKASLGSDKKVGWGIISNYLDGIQLNKGLELDLSLDVEDVKRTIRRLLCEVAVIHAIGIVHMDITPPNIILNANQREAYIVDWDLAQISGSELLTVTVAYPYEQSIPLPPGFDPRFADATPHTFFDVWYLPVDILNIIAIFDQDMRQLFGGNRPYPMFFIKFPTIDKLRGLKAHLKKKKSRETWPPDYDAVKDYEYYDENVTKEHLDRFRETLSKYVDPALFYGVYLDALDDRKRLSAIDLLNLLADNPR
ncbi:MAG: serine/threonine-protein kinase [Candidatus Atabeyarchaeum deiterrae]